MDTSVTQLLAVPPLTPRAVRTVLRHPSTRARPTLLPAFPSARTATHAGSSQSAESWAALNTHEAPALVTAAARLLAEEAEQKRQGARPASPAPCPSPNPAWLLSQHEYERVVACSEAAADRKSAQEVWRVCQSEAEAARAAYVAAEAEQTAREEHVEALERRAAQLAWPRSAAKCRRKGRRFDPAAAKRKREQLLAKARRARAALDPCALELRDLLITDDIAQVGAWQAAQEVSRADCALRCALAALRPRTRRRAVAAGLLHPSDCEE